MRKSSIEWLEERLTISLGEDIKGLRGFFVIAKEIHKEEIVDAHINGQSEFDEGSRRTINDKFAKMYYSEKFNTKEK